MIDNIEGRHLEETFKNIAYHVCQFNFQIGYLNPNADPKTGQLNKDVDWGKLIRKFNLETATMTAEFQGKPLSLPTITIEEVIANLRKTRAPEGIAKLRNQWADQLQSWLKAQEVNSTGETLSL